MENSEIYKILLQFGMIALVVESALKSLFSTQAFKKYILEGFVGEYISKPTFAIGASLLLCYQTNFDILGKLTDSATSDIGIILTALIVSRGSGGFADFLRNRKKIKEALNNAEVIKIENGNGVKKEK